jgi:hypothetical protein
MSTGFARNILNLGNNIVVAVTGVSADETLPGNGHRYLLSCNTDCYVAWGTGAQTATTAANGFELFMPSGLTIVVDVGTADTIAAIQDSANGTLVAHELLFI